MLFRYVARLIFPILSILTSVVSAQPYKVTIIGDSNTLGGSGTEAESIAAKVQEQLGSNFVVMNRGKSGYCLRSQCSPSYMANSQFRAEAIADRADVYVIAFGTNDGRYQVDWQPSNPRYSVNWPVAPASLELAKNDFKQSYINLINEIRQNNSSAAVIIVTPPKVYETAVSKEYGTIDRNVSGGVVPLIREIGFSSNTTVVDVNPSIDNTQDLTNDGVHLNARGAYKYGVAIRDTICKEKLIAASACPLKNIASDGIATQSSTYIGVAGPDFAKFAIDGVASQSYSSPATPHISHTNYDNQPWLEVDLKGIRIVDSIKFIPRTDNSAWQRNQGLYVLTSSIPFHSNSLSAELSKSNVTSHYFPNANSSPINISTNMATQYMRYVRVWLAGTNWLGVAELEIFERTTPRQ